MVASSGVNIAATSDISQTNHNTYANNFTLGIGSAVLLPD
jgi:hypothetical protein